MTSCGSVLYLAGGDMVRMSIVSRPVTASAADAPPTRSGVEDPARIALSEVRREPARAIYGPSVVVRGSG
jgi:hypothetical protein